MPSAVRVFRPGRGWSPPFACLRKVREVVCYDALPVHHFQPMRLPRLIFRSSVLLLALYGGTALAQSRGAAARELGREILAVTGRRARIQFSFANQSSVGVSEAAALRRGVEAELRAGGARLVAGGARASRVSVTLSENWRNLLLVAEVEHGKGNRVVIVARPRTNAAAGAGQQVVSLTRRIVWRQHARFLSFLQWQSPADKSSYLWILEPGRLLLYRRDQGQWRQRGEAEIAHDGPWPRDLRGLLWIEPAGTEGKPGKSSASRLHASLPGVECQMPLAPAAGSLPLSCGRADAHSFPIFQAGTIGATASLAPDRNFFGASVEREGTDVNLEPFYSSTIVDDDRGDPVLLAAALDGKTYLYDEAGKPLGSVDEWGSEIAGVETDCGNGWQALASRPGDWTTNDSLAAYEIIEGKAVGIGEPIDFPGPVLSLWPEPGGEAAAAIVFDRGARFYEAYTVTLTCGR